MALEPFVPRHGAGLPPIPPGPLFADREGRSRFVASHFAPLWTGPVLDVGCFRRALAPLLPDGCPYIGIDRMGRPDLVVDLDRGFIPFADGSFEVVVCVDVLEHLEQIHHVFDELMRVSGHRVVVSLPNCWHGAWRWFLPGPPPASGKYYGLPAQPPPDRHRWFFNTFEAAAFLKARAAQANARIEYLDCSLPASPWRRRLIQGIAGRNHWLWSAATLWAVVTRNAPTP